MGVRHEKVVLTLEDHFTSEMARAAAATAVLRQEVERLERQRARDGRMTDQNTASYRRMTEELRRQQTAAAGAANGLNNFNRQLPPTARNTRQLSNEINTASGRLGLLASAAITLGPALIPATAAAIPAVTGLANQLGIAALAAGTAVVAFQGVGDALKAVNEYDLEPTAANLEKVGETFGRLDRDTQIFTLRISTMRGQIAALRDAAASGFFPPLTRELGEVDVLLERVESLLFVTGRAAGMELAAGLESMNGDRWKEFFGFLDREAVPTMHDLAQIIGNSGHALTEMWMAFQPLNRDFGDWLVEVTADWDRWAQGLAESESFEDFVDYIQDNGPRVAETVGALAGALADVVVAAAPLGGPALEALEAIADVVSAIASSDIGTPLLAGVAAMTLLSRTTRAFNAVAGSTMVGNIRNISGDYRAAAASGGIWSRQMGPLTQQMAAQRAQAERLQRTIKGFAAGGAAIAGLGIAASGAADGLGLTNTVSLGLMGTLAGPWGAAVGAGVGLLMDFTAATDAAAEAQATASDWVDAFRATLDRQSGAVTAATREQVAMAVANDDVREAADALGMSMDQVVELVYAGEDALAAFANQALVSRDATQEEIDAASGYGTLLNEILPYRAALEEARNSQAAFIEGVGEGGAAFDASAAAIERMTTAYERWTDTLSAFDAVTTMAGALATLDTVVAETGVSFDASTEKGQAFREALSGWSQATQDLLDNTPVLERGAMIEEQIRALSSELGISIDTAWDWANAVGISAETVNAAMAQAEAQAGLLGDRFRSLPPEVLTEIATYGIPQTEAQVDALVQKYGLAEGTRSTLMAVMTESAELQITNYRQMLNAIPSSVRTRLIIEELRSRASSTPTGNWLNNYTPPAGRAGGVVARAAGGLDLPDAHRPEITRPGSPLRIWSEPETMGEAYIPLANDWRRPRAINTWQQTGRELGVMHFADGGLRDALRSQTFARGGIGGWADTPRTIAMPAVATNYAAAASQSAFQESQASLVRMMRSEHRDFMRAIEKLPREVNDGVRYGIRDRDAKFAVSRKVAGR